MYIKPQTVIPSNIKITKCPAHEGTTRSLYALERAQEKKLERIAEKKRKAELFAAALKAGHSVEEALRMIENG